MWNIYIFGLLFLYAPSHKTWGNEDTHSTGQSFTRFLHSRVPVLRLRIRIRIRMFLGLLDPDPLVRGMDPDPCIIMQNSKKNLDFYCFVTSFCFFIFEKLRKCTFKK